MIGVRPGGRGKRGKRLTLRQSRQELHTWLRWHGLPVDTAVYPEVQPHWRTRRVRRYA